MDQNGNIVTTPYLFTKSDVDEFIVGPVGTEAASSTTYL
jgi:hypothetical protein